MSQQEELTLTFNEVQTQVALKEFKRLFPEWENQIEKHEKVIEKYLLTGEKPKPEDPIYSEKYPVSLDKKLAEAEKSVIEIDECTLSVAKTIIEGILLIISVIAFKPPVNSRVYYLVGRKIGQAEVLSQFRRVIFELSEAIASSNATEAAKGLLKIAEMVISFGIIQTIFDAIISELSWWDAAVFVATTIPQVLAFILTGGAAFIAKLVVVILDAVLFTASVVETVEKCS